MEFGSISNVAVISAENETRKPGSSAVLVCYVHFPLRHFGKAWNIFLLSPALYGLNSTIDWDMVVSQSQSRSTTLNRKP